MLLQCGLSLLGYQVTSPTSSIYLFLFGTHCLQSESKSLRRWCLFYINPYIISKMEKESCFFFLLVLVTGAVYLPSSMEAMRLKQGEEQQRLWSLWLCGTGWLGWKSTVYHISALPRKLFKKQEIKKDVFKKQQVRKTVTMKLTFLLHQRRLIKSLMDKFQGWGK